MMRHEMEKVYRWGKLFGSLGALSLTMGCYNAPKASAGIHHPTTVMASGPTEDAYIYYPAIGVYYNTTRHQYVYREGRSWVDRPYLPSVWSSKLAGTPAVALDFHDAPEKHH